MTRDGGYRASVATASGHHLPHSAYLEWDSDDRQAEDEVRAYDAESCNDCGVHPETWSAKYGGDVRKPAVVPTWKYCHVCFLIARCSAAGPPAGKDAEGWRIVLERATYESQAS